jgi:hypothetical protein
LGVVVIQMIAAAKLYATGAVFGMFGSVERAINISLLVRGLILVLSSNCVTTAEVVLPRRSNTQHSVCHTGETIEHQSTLESNN